MLNPREPAAIFAASATTSEDQDRQTERDKLEIEREKLKVEPERLGVEREKLKIEESKEWWSRVTGAVALVVPLVAALMTLLYTASSFRTQMAQQAREQVESAKLAFEMKAAEIAFAGRTPEAVKNRAAALKRMFGDRLSSTFVAPFDPKDYGGGKEAPEGKQTFLEMTCSAARTLNPRTTSTGSRDSWMFTAGKPDGTRRCRCGAGGWSGTRFPAERSQH